MVQKKQAQNQTKQTHIQQILKSKQQHKNKTKGHKSKVTFFKKISKLRGRGGDIPWGEVRASLRFEKKTEFIDTSLKIIDILPIFFEPK